MNKQEEIIKASIIAGLSLWGLPNIKRYGESVSYWSKKLDIDLTKFHRVSGTGLMWHRDEDKYLIHRSKFSERIMELSEDVGFIDEEECFGNSMIDDPEYVFNLKGKGFTGRSTKSELFNKRLRTSDGKLYTCWAGKIFVYKMDIDSVKEAKRFIRKLIKERR